MEIHKPWGRKNPLCAPVLVLVVRGGGPCMYIGGEGHKDLKERKKKREARKAVRDIRREVKVACER